MVVQVDADAMDVLGMLEQEPSAVERLLTGRADVAGRLILICEKDTKKVLLMVRSLHYSTRRVCI